MRRHVTLTLVNGGRVRSWSMRRARGSACRAAIAATDRDQPFEVAVAC